MSVLGFDFGAVVTLFYLWHKTEEPTCLMIKTMTLEAAILLGNNGFHT